MANITNKTIPIKTKPTVIGEENVGLPKMDLTQQSKRKKSDSEIGRSKFES